MDYTYDSCLYEFTPLQIERMFAIWDYFRAQPSPVCAEEYMWYAEIDIIPDYFPAEISWELADYTGEVFATGGANSVAGCLPKGLYTFTIYDEFGDGICCDYGLGLITLSLDGEIVASGGEYDASESVTFGSVCADAIQSSTESDHVADNAILVGIDGEDLIAKTTRETSPWLEVEFPVAVGVGKIAIYGAPAEDPLASFNVKFYDEYSMEVASYWFSGALDVANGIPLVFAPGIVAKKMLIKMSGDDKVLSLSKVDFYPMFSVHSPITFDLNVCPVLPSKSSKGSKSNKKSPKNLVTMKTK